MERTRPRLTGSPPRARGSKRWYLPRKADSGRAWGRVGPVTSELWVLCAIHRTAAVTDTSSRSSDSKTAAIPVGALRGDCAGAGAPRAAWEGRGQGRRATVGQQGGGAAPRAEGRGRRRRRPAAAELPQAEAYLRPSVKAAGCVPEDRFDGLRNAAAPLSPLHRGATCRVSGTRPGKARGRESSQTVEVNNSLETPANAFCDKHILFFQEFNKFSRFNLNHPKKSKDEVSLTLPLSFSQAEFSGPRPMRCPKVFQHWN